MDEAMRSQHRKLIQEYQAEIKDCEQQQKHLKDQHRKNYEKYRAGDLDQKAFQSAKEQIDVSKEQSKKRVQELESLIHTEEEILLKKNIPVGQMMEFLGYETLTREMLEKYVEGIYVYDDGRVEVRWKL
jgi:ribosomal protein L19